MAGSLRLFGAALCFVFLAACGGGGGSSTPPPVAPPVTPPVVTPPTPVYVISGLVTGLNGTLVLQVNGGNDLTVTSNGTTNAAVAMATALTNGASYAVTVKTQPTNPAQNCTVTNGSGIVFSNSSTGGTITGLVVNCALLSMNLVSSTPAASAHALSCAVAPKLVFSRPIDAATAIAGNITLTTGSTNQAFIASVVGAEVTITPTSRLTRFVNYTLTANTSVHGTLGEVLAAPVAVTFGCDGEWRTAAVAPKPADSDSEFPRVAMDANGNGFSVWSQQDNGVYSVYAQRFDAVTGWGTPVQIDHQSTDTWTATVGMDGAGNAIAVFLVNDGAQNSVWSARWTPGAGWAPETKIDALPDDAENPEIAVNANGDAIATWYQSDVNDGGWYSAVSNHYTAGAGWGTAQVLDTLSNGNALNPRVAIDSAGNGVAVWQQRGAPGRNDIWSSRYTAGSGWGAPVLVETNDSGTAQLPRVKLDAAGNGLAVWYQYDGTHYNVWSNRFTAANGWGTAELIETDDTGDTQFPRIDIDPAGNAIAVWAQSDGTHFNIRANRYVAGAGWGTATTIESDTANDATTPWVALDAAGNAIVTWQQSDGTHINIWARQFSVANGWGTAKLLDTDDAGDADSPMVVSDPKGNALVVWEQFDGAHMNAASIEFDY